VDSDLPALVTSFVGEERIRQVIADHLGHVLK